ncbi:hypothetical protein AVEN_240488-1 [Araneus ventricosus]|uniref:Uncharacterized protein n=1 Tax=Araneus ventricosus TaxID=182803 RepID=A0A4Y2HMG2_ARAVE|nr:hypothetical protein AVEN_240488-1 [Araneus ventricosus]
MSVFRRPDLRSQRPKSIFSPPRKSIPCSFLSSSKILSFSIFAFLFLTLIFSLLGERSKASPRILVNFVGGVYFSQPLLVPYLWSFCRKRVLRLEINDPINHFH